MKRILRISSLVGLFFVIAFFSFVITLDFAGFRRLQGNEIVFDPSFADASEDLVAVQNDASPHVISVEQALRIMDVNTYQHTDTRVLLRVVGDVAPVRVADIQLRRKGMTYAFSGMGELFKRDDVSLVNLETPLINECPERNDGMIFCGLPIFAGAMRDAGIDVVGLANNHSGNYGERGLTETVTHLDQASVLSVQSEELLLSKVKDIVFGFIAVNDVTSKGVNRDAVRESIERAKLQADVLIISVHWGAEYELFPQAAAGVAPNDPRELARWFIDNGADVIVGHHPHVVQGVELYNDKFIAYSHGNFIFDQEWSRETKEGVIGNYVFEHKKLVDVFFTPIVIEDWVRPRIATAAESETILKRMKKSSDLLRTDVR